MPLMLLDLDNTLIDRNAAFRLWASGFLSGIGAEDDLDWFMDADADGYTPRAELALLLCRRYRLTSSVSSLVEILLMHHVDYVTLERAVLDQPQVRPDPRRFDVASRDSHDHRSNQTLVPRPHAASVSSSTIVSIMAVNSSACVMGR